MTLLKNKYFILSLLLTGILGTSQIFAQTPPGDPLGGKDSLVLENERIEDVIDSDKPYVKPPFQEIKQGTSDPVTYTSKDFYIETDFEPAPPDIQPIEREKRRKLSNNFLKLGIGRYLTPMAKLYVNNGQDKNVDVGLNFNHLSAHQDQVTLRKFREDYGTLQASTIQDDYTLGGKLYVYNTAYFNYAGDDTTLSTDEQVREDSLGMNFTRFGLGANLLSNYDANLGYEYNAAAGIKLYSGKRGNSEFHLDLTPSAAYFITDEAKVGANIDFTYVRGKINEVNQNRIYFDIMPFVNFDNDIVSVTAGVRFNAFNNSIDSSGVSNFGPYIEASYAVSPEALTIFAGYTTKMTHNHYYDMIYENRYLSNNVEIKPTVEKMNVFIGGKGNAGQKLDYAARIYYKRIQNQLMYFTTDSVYFNTLYDSLMTVTGAHIEVNYDLSKELKAGAAMSINNYSTSNQDSLTEKFWHAAPFRLDVYGAYTWDEKLTAKASLNIYGATPMAVNSEGGIEKRGLFPDVNLSADYRLTPGFSVFLEVNDLLNLKYQRWNNYPERQLDFNGGITLSF